MGTSAADTRMSTLRDVAKRARVSPMTVSRVANGASGVRPETRRRVEKAIADLGFIPNGVARGLKSSKTGSLGLIVPDIVNPFFAVVVRGAETVARRAGYRLLLCISENDLALERQYVEDMISHQVEGLLIAPVGDRSQANILPLVQRKFPFVLMDRGVQGLDCDLVQGDNLAGARRLIRHLISIGHRRIAAIMEPDNVSTARERLLGYREALESAGIAFDPELVAETSGDRNGGYSATHQILSLHPLPTAILAINNMTALGVMQAVRERGPPSADRHRAGLLRRRRAPGGPVAVSDGHEPTGRELRDRRRAALARPHRRQVGRAPSSGGAAASPAGPRIVRRQGGAARRATGRPGGRLSRDRFALSRA